MTLQAVVDECNRIIRMRHDSVKIEGKESAPAHYIKTEMVLKRKNKQITKPNPCHLCTGLHFNSECSLKGKVDYFCGKLGHVSLHCKKKTFF